LHKRRFPSIIEGTIAAFPSNVKGEARIDLKNLETFLPKPGCLLSQSDAIAANLGNQAESGILDFRQTLHLAARKASHKFIK